MLAPFQRLLCEFKSFIMKMFGDLLSNLVVATNLAPMWCGNYDGINVFDAKVDLYNLYVDVDQHFSHD
jgi:hypothetical protein